MLTKYHGQNLPKQRGRARDGWAAVRVLAGRIVDIDPTHWTCTVVTEAGGKRLRSVDMGAAYLHPFDGEGVYIMPEVGAPVWVTRSSEGDYPWFIQRFRGYPAKSINEGSRQNQPSFRTNRPRLGPGDIFLTTRDRNGLKLRRGGVTEIFGSPLAKTIYSGRDGTIHSIAKNIQLDTFGGSVLWKAARKEKDPDGHQATAAAIRLKEFADDRAHVVRVDIGGQLSVPTQGETDGAFGTVGAAPASAELVTAPVVHLRVFQDGNVEEDALTEASSVSFDKSGQAEVALKGALYVEIRGSKNVTLKLSPDGTVQLTSDSDIHLDSDTKITTQAAALTTVNDGSTVKVGTGTAKVIYDLDLSSKMAAMAVELITVAKMVGMPTAGIEAILTSFSAQAFTSKKLETE